jgi:hypothetical protein
MSMPNSVRYYDSTMSGAPSLSNTAGSLISLLDGCLVDGFGSVNIDGTDGLVVTSNVATATVSAGHQFAMVGNTGPVIRIENASPSGLNGDWRVTVTSSTQFTFATSGISDQTATGTITAKRAPAGFEKAFSGTNKAAYRSLDIEGTQLYCRIDDTGTTNARICGYEAMSDVDTEAVTGVGLFPTEAQLSGGGYALKAISGTRDWMVVADSQWFTFMSVYDGTKITPVSFGDFISFVAADAFRCGVWSNNSGSTVEATGFGLCNSSTSKIALARSYLQTGTAILPFQYSHAKSASYIGQAGASYPNPGNNELVVASIDVWDSATIIRGQLPGHYSPLHASASLTDMEIVNVSGRDMIVRRFNIGGSGNNGAVAIDLTGPWR